MCSQFMLGVPQHRPTKLVSRPIGRTVLPAGGGSPSPYHGSMMVMGAS